jgi:tetratricopeptide (TPR) repeat protein
MDSHHCQRCVVMQADKQTGARRATVRNEGDVQVRIPGPYPVAYRAIVPKQSECANLLVPVCLSASHLAYGSIRMEPVFMVLGQSAGTAAAMAIDGDMAVQQVDYSKLRTRLLADHQMLDAPAARNAPQGRTTAPPAATNDAAKRVEATARHAAAVADLDAAIKLEPRNASLYARRGDEHFMLAEFKQSVADYDHEISLAPAAGPGHWQRGISCYYAGQYAEGAKQFAAYHSKVDDNDVENSIWRCMCMARESGLEKARREMLVVKHDGRIGMMEAYQMFAGKAEPQSVLKAAETDAPPEQLNQQRFYANLYVGLYYDITGRNDLAREHLQEAVKHRIDHTMWEVARVQAELLDKRP